jgi:tetratricopeptide (TPR) repeat protein
MQHFTDREDQQSVFRRYLGSTLEPPVLCFYGIGGAGKTWLLKKLMGIVPSGIPTAFLDFDRERGGRTFTIDPSSGLQEIRRQLGVGCARFDVAYNVMLFKQGVRDDKNVLLEVASEITATEGTNAIAGAASDVIELAASTAFAVHSLPGVPALLKHLSKPLLEKIKGTSFEAMLCRTEVQKLALELRSKTAQQIGDELVEYLAQDLRENLPTHLNRAVSAVIFFDTFEGIGTELLNEQHRRQSEAWVRSVASAFNFALVVIGGQNRISWENIDPDWSTHLEQHLVGGLSENDARQFLSKCAISGEELQNAILATSKEADGGFHCFSLGLCADVVYHDRKNGIATSPESLRLPPRDWKRLADRFLKSLGSDHRARWISRLAITPRFDEAAAKAAFSEQRMIEQDTAWDELRGYSFVERSVDQPKWFSIRYQMRRALELQPANEERVMSDHAWWHQLWKARSTSATDQEASLAWYHKYFLSPDEAVEAWKTLAEAARSEVPARMTEHLRLLAWWQPLGLNSAGPLSQEKAYELSVLAAELQEASLGDRGANLRQAIACYEAALRVYTERDFPQDWAMTQNNLGNAWGDLPTGDRGANLRQAISCYETALKIYTEQDFPQDWAMTQNNLGTAWWDLRTGDRGANLRQAIACYEAALRIYTEQDFPQEWAITKNNLTLSISILETLSIERDKE